MEILGKIDPNKVYKVIDGNVAVSSVSSPDPSWNDVKAGQVVLSRGMGGPAVAQLQRLLQLDPDGKFGSQTETAVHAFQRDHQLKPDGVVGTATLALALGLLLGVLDPAHPGPAAPPPRADPKPPPDPNAGVDAWIRRRQGEPFLPDRPPE